MTSRKSDPRKESKLIREQRHELVARGMVRGLTAIEIADSIATGGQGGTPILVNPVTEQPYSDETIRLDMRAIEKKWQASTKHSVEKHRAQQLAELAEVKREAWQLKNHAVIISALAHEAKLTDTAAPLRLNLGLVSDWWDAIARLGHDPEIILKAMIAELGAQQR